MREPSPPRRGAVAVLLAISAALAGCARRATAAECDRVLDHYVDLLVRQENPGIDGEALRALIARTRARVVREREFDCCPRELLEEDAVCALAAGSVDELERCIE